MRNKSKGIVGKLKKRLRQSKYRKKKYYNLESRQKKMRRREAIKTIRSNVNIKDYALFVLRKVPGVLIWLLCIAISLAAAKALVSTYGQRISVVGDSMNPILNNGDVCLINKHKKSFKRGDIIAFTTKSNDSHYYVKRVIALPGETIKIFENTIFVDGEKLPESYIITSIDDAGVASKEITLGEDEYFVLGDDRENSEDSRDKRIGNITKDTICGKAWFVISPKSRMGFI